MIYLDNAATTKPCDEAVGAAVKAAEEFGNPSSLHGMGLNAEKLVEKSRAVVAQRLDCEKRNVYFTSGGTEANNLAIFGTAQVMRRRGLHVVTTEIEHPSVLQCFKRLEKIGFRVTYVAPEPSGTVSAEAVKKVLRRDTVLVSVMHVNNETGEILPIDRLKRIIKSRSPNAKLHCDCVQSFCKVPIKAKRWDADLISVSAHKVRGFKGTGALYIKNLKILPMMYGGEQQNEIRPGTENVMGILAFANAIEACRNDYDMVQFRLKFIDAVFENIDNVVLNGSRDNNSGSIVNLSFPGVKAEVLLHSLESRGIYVSTGAACSSHKQTPNHVLAAMGKSNDEIDSAIRISFIEPLSDEDMEKTVLTLKEEVKTLRSRS